MRELLDEPPHCGLLILGSHELEQWHSRIVSGFRRLSGLTMDEARLILQEELGRQLPEAAIKSALADCAVARWRSRGEKYVSARRLFLAIEDAKGGEEGGE